MLQARKCVCILILALTVVLAADASAQPGDSPQDSPQDSQGIQGLGEATDENEYELDLTVPAREVTPPAPQTPEEKRAAETLAREQAIEQHLAAAASAERDGRIDQPAGDCAWFYYRKALDMDPQNGSAEAGLKRVQAALIARAVEYALDMDFESAERVLEDAALVRDDRAAIDQATQEILDTRNQRAGELEVAAVLAMDAGDFEQAERMLIELIALGDMDTTVNQLRRRLEEARVYGGFKPGQAVRDHFLNQPVWTPESVILTAGSFIMGSSAFEDGRKDHEGPEHRVTFRRGFALGRTEVTVEQFRDFVKRTGYKTDAEKVGYSRVYDHRSGHLSQRDDVTWELDYEGREARNDEPVIHVSWNDAHAYTRWLALGTGKAYRLPSEAEFEYALRGGKTARYWWGNGSPDRPVENLTGEGDVSRSQRQWSTFFDGYSDRFWGPAPVASFEPNPFGLFDIGGNVGEWVMDCWHDTYLRAPIDGTAWLNPGCKQRIVRGGSWASSPNQSRAAYRISAKPEHAGARIGFRIARDL
jgi:formylglycine-generating enzyme required for sulfatase activity